MLRDDPELTFLVRHWSNGGSALPAVRRLMEKHSPAEAAILARLALRMDGCPDREELEKCVSVAANTSEDWIAALEQFAKSPSEERWAELMRFVPEDVFYDRFRQSIAILIGLGCDGDILFRCATKDAMTTAAFDIVETGTVSPETIVARGEGSAARAAWLGLAAQAAFVRGDRWSTVKYLREAVEDEDSAFLAWASISEIRRDADDDLNADLDKVGVPRV